MKNLIVNVIILLGAAILLGAIVPLYRLKHQFPNDQLNRKWYLILILNLLFVLGYIGYLFVDQEDVHPTADLIVHSVFFLGACFVWMTSYLSLQIALDLQRVTILEQESIIDPVIGIFNRRYLDRRLEEEFARARRHKLPLSVLMLDIDRFKNVNDTYGHPAGDLILRRLGELILGEVRTGDVVARYGGEEILVIAVNTPPASAAALAERIRRKVESYAFQIPGDHNCQQTVHVTISAGVGGFNENCRSCAHLLQQVDEALYCAKNNGRNRITLSDVVLRGLA